MKEDRAKKQIRQKTSESDSRKLHELQVSEVRYRRLFETAQDGILLLDAETGQIRDVNPFLLTMLGYSYEEFLGKNLWEIGLFKDIAGSKDAFIELQNKEYIRYEDLPLETKGGKPIAVEFVSNVYQIDHEKVIQCNIRNITDRKKAEKALQELEGKYHLLMDKALVISEETLRLVVESLIVGIIVTDLKGTILQANQAVVLLHGFHNKEEIIGQNVLKLVDKIDRARALENTNKALVEGYYKDVEFTLLRVDGSNFAAELSAAIIKDTPGTPQGIVFITRDITERKNAEAEISHLASFPELNPNPILEMDATGNVKYANPAARMRFSDMMVLGSEHPFLIGLINVIQKGETHLVTRDVSIGDSWYEQELAYVPSTQSYRLYAVDITERKRAEAELELRAQLLDAATDAIITLDAKGNVIYFNEVAHRSRGYTREEMTGKKLRDLVSPKFFELISSQADKILKEKGEALFETSDLCKDNSTIPVEVHSRIIRLGEQGYIVNISRDITERKQGEEELKQSNAALYKVMQDTIQAMAVTCEMRDPYTAGHQQRVAQLVVVIAEELHLSDNEKMGLRTAALVHDIGKMSIPAEILSKPGKLTTIELELVKMHVQASYDILKGIDFPWPVAEIVYQHHERMDGSGYPNALSGKDIRLEARILAVADVVEAMTSHRPYRPAMGIDKALEEISNNRGTLYDADVVNACLMVINKGFKFEEVITK